LKTLNQLLYFLRQGLVNLARHSLYTTVGVLTLAVSLVLVGFLGLVLWKADTMVDRLTGGLKLTIYLEPDTPRGAADELARVIREQWREVTAVEYHSSNDDRARNLKLLPTQLVEELDPDLIPAQPYVEVVLDVELLDEQRTDAIVKWFSAMDEVQGVDEVLFGAQKIGLAFSLLRGARNMGLFVSFVIVLAALFFVITTTRLIVEARRREIEILLLVGATRNFVRLPHYIEGLVQGLAAGLLAFLSVYAIQRQMVSTLRGENLLQVPLDLLPPGMILWFIVGGATLGLAGSALGLARYLRKQAW